MRIVSLAVTAWKGLERVELLDLAPDLNLVVGPNADSDSPARRNRSRANTAASNREDATTSTEWATPLESRNDTSQHASDTVPV